MTEQLKPTQAPWYADEGGSVSSDDGDTICDCCTDGFITYEQKISNARLIAASPKMLAALKAILNPTGEIELSRLLDEAQAVVDEVERK